MADPHNDPLDLHSKPEVLDAQRAADDAWARLEQYRKEVDEARRADAQPAEESWGRPVLRPWTEDENAEFAKRRAAAVAASENRARIMREVGLVSTFEVESEVRKHARENSAGTGGG
jgi:hypothetical protein